MNVSSNAPAALAVPLQQASAVLAGTAAGARAGATAGATAPARFIASALASAARPATAKPGATRPKPTSTSTGTSKAAGYSSGASGDYAFLKDPKLSVDEKLFRFICAVAQKADDDLLKKMEEMKGGSAGKASASGPAAAGAKKPFSLWSAAKSLIPPLRLASKLAGDAGIKTLLKNVSGPLLAAACTAVGLPMLAPLAAKVGPQLATAVAGAVESAVNGATGATAAAGEGGTGGTTGGSTSAGSARNEQVQMMELQRLVDKQKEMFSLVSNILRATHDTRMAVIGNVR